MSDPPWSVEEGALRLAVRLTPRARKDALAGVIDSGDGRSALSVRLTAPPVEGAANRALVEFLARTLDVPKTAVTIVSGEKARLKILRIAGLDPARLEILL